MTENVNPDRILKTLGDIYARHLEKEYGVSVEVEIERRNDVQSGRSTA